MINCLNYFLNSFIHSLKIKESKNGERYKGGNSFPMEVQ